jgi:hypothetical protein
MYICSPKQGEYGYIALNTVKMAVSTLPIYGDKFWYGRTPYFPLIRSHTKSNITAGDTRRKIISKHSFHIFKIRKVGSKNRYLSFET